MVNLVEAVTPLVISIMKTVGTVPHMVQIDSETKINFWVPEQTLKKPNKTNVSKPEKPTKPAVVLIHGFAGDGMVTWWFQVTSLSKKYSVYIPDVIFFGGSHTKNTNRSAAFQAECLVKGLAILGVDKFVPVGFSYGGFVAFKMAEMYPEAVRAIVVSGSVVALTETLTESSLRRVGYSSLPEMLLPTTVKELRAVLSLGLYRKMWLPTKLLKDFLKVMYHHRKERAELLNALVIRDKDATIPKFSQRIHIIWGEADQIFKLENAQNMKTQLGEKTTLDIIKKAGHLVQLERPCVYNRCLKKFLAEVHENPNPSKN